MTVSKTRTRLVDVARGLFAKQGLENTTMNDIAVASGKGRRTLYTYFKNKEDIYFAVIETELEHLSAQLSEVANKRMDLEEKLVEIIYVHLHSIKEVVLRNGNLRAEFFRNIWMVEKVRKHFDQKCGIGGRRDALLRERVGGALHLRPLGRGTEQGGNAPYGEDIDTPRIAG